MAFSERIWISSPGPTSTVPREPSPRWSSTVATSSGAGAAVVAGAGAAVVAAGAAVVAAGAASSASSEPQAPAISEKPKSSASGTRARRNIVILPPCGGSPVHAVSSATGWWPRPPDDEGMRERDACHMDLPYNSQPSPFRNTARSSHLSGKDRAGRQTRSTVGAQATTTFRIPHVRPVVGFGHAGASCRRT